ncbi:rhomboid family intramembrane serine protease [Gracilibacillus alcaliphilus]|uniref:rhomboid family intramembrane serine protease n=1 Tax=Gracilibacillus alcaliphilus TaxID=1401441 RepID=UPI00195CF0EF|nr:rhomboid family intramembrane serine protease [Gracilibacillus alcaliphilus]MBM7675025.1 rhomboid protease GluP [Gracilibacillus alcaliphilus]
MLVDNQFVQCKLVLHLMEEEHYELLTASPDFQNYLLWKREKRHSHIVHVSTKQAEWREDLLRSVQSVEENVLKNLQQALLFQKVSFYHLFINEYQPLEGGRQAQEPVKKYKKIESSKVYIWEREDQEDLVRFFREAKLQKPLSFTVSGQGLYLTYEVQALQQRISQLHKQEAKKVQHVFRRAKPYITYFLLVINVVLFLLVESQGGSMNPEVLIEFGAKYNIAVLDGEWWRIITSMFLHIGILHLLLNMMALFFIGTLVERMYGNLRFFLIYFLSGIAGGLCSFAFNPSVGAGASGAIFGLFGALLYFGLKKPNLFFKTIGANVIFIVILNIIFGFTIPQIDNGAHLGGLVGGFIVAAMVMLPEMKARLQQLLALVVYLMYVAGVIWYGVSNDEVQNHETLRGQHAQQLLAEERYPEMVETIDQALPYANELKPELLFLRSVAYIRLSDYVQAETDLKEVVEERPEFEEAWFNLALLYHQEDRQEEALAAMEQLLEINDREENYQELYEEILSDVPASDTGKQS